jgi:hypothetical protein
MYVDMEETVKRNSDVNVGSAVCKACSVMWNLDTNSTFASAPRITTENRDRFGR